MAFFRRVDLAAVKSSARGSRQARSGDSDCRGLHRSGRGPRLPARSAGRRMQRVSAMLTPAILVVGRLGLDRPDAAAAARSLACPPNSAVEIYAKAEFLNPGGSVKDRAAAAIIADGERTGRLHAGVDDPRCDVRQYRHRLRDDRRGARLQAEAVRARERHGRAQADAARVRRRARADRARWKASDGAIREARRLFAENPERYFYADQYNNDANWRAHYDTTAPEILGADRRPGDAFRRRASARAARSSASAGGCASIAATSG